MEEIKTTFSTGERQMKKALPQVAADHRARYSWALKYLHGMSTVLDVGAGVGYGSFMMANVCGKVIAYDKAEEARKFWRANYALPNVVFVQVDLTKYRFPELGDLAVCFEFIEHIEDPESILSNLTHNVPRILLSVPNEQTNPFDPTRYPWHKRHYTGLELERLLSNSGWKIKNMWSQVSKNEPELIEQIDGKTLVVLAEHA